MRKKMIALALALAVSLALLPAFALSASADLASPTLEPLTWDQVNTDGFYAESFNASTFAMAENNGVLYAGTINMTDGCQVWRYDGPDPEDWTQVNENGFASLGPTASEYKAVTPVVAKDNQIVYSLASYGGKLYAGTYNTISGCQVWRYDGPDPANWVQVNASGFGSTANQGASSMLVSGGKLWVGVQSSGGNSAPVWAYDGATWTQMNSNGFGVSGNQAVRSLAEFNGKLYAGTSNSSGFQVWRYDGPTTADWTQVATGGLGSTNNIDARSLCAYEGQLYLGVTNSSGTSGGTVFAYDPAGGTWSDLAPPWMEWTNPPNAVRNLVVYRDGLWAGLSGWETPAMVWVSDGTDWAQMNTSGFADLEDAIAIHSLVVFEDRLWAGTKAGLDNGSGNYYAQVWRSRYPELSMTKTAPETISPNETFTFDITITNAGDGDANDVALIDPNFNPELITTVPGSTTCSDPNAIILLEDPIVFIQGITVPAGGTVNVSFDVTVADDSIGGVIGNAAIAAHLTEGIPSNETETRIVAPTWYLAEGYTGEGFETWVLVQNPNDKPTKVGLAFDTEAGEVVLPELQGLPVPANSRISIPVQNYYPGHDVATRVTSTDQIIVCERAMYNTDRTWATESVGTTTLDTVWYLAEGCTIGSDTWVMVQNPNPEPVELDLSFITDFGLYAPSGLQNVPLAANSRRSFHVNQYVDSYDASTVVTATNGVVCERSMYAADRAWAHTSVGTSRSGTTWYLAEGSTIDMETWILVQNPGANPLKADIKFLTDQGEVQGPQDVIPAFTRRSYNAGEYVQSYDVSTLVATEYGEVVCERSMYDPSRTWGTCSVGTIAPMQQWYLAEGSTDGGMETWVLVENPNAADVTVTLTLDTGTGQVKPDALKDVVVPAKSRKSFRINDYVTTYDVSTRVEANGPVVCERAMYGPGRVWATASIGYSR
jgi:uncharacterized repeat protein (TIGR01451 family)